MKTIGLFLGTTEDDYGKDVVRGVTEGLQGTRTRLICFTSGSIHSQHGYEAQRNVLYELVDRTAIDALIVAGSLSHSVNADELTAFCRGYTPLPVVVMSVSLPGITSVVVDNRAGFRQIMDHLIGRHGYTRLAFVGGPPDQQETDERKAVFLESLAAAGLEVHPEWVIHGDYTRLSGADAAKRLAAVLKASPGFPPFQAIVAANDSMAMGIQDYLAGQGWHFPADCAVTGFDDLPESRSHLPPLTTCFQPVVRLATEAAGLALRILDGHPVPELTRIAPTLVLRSSCGCPPPATEHLGREDLRLALETVKAEWMRESRERAVTSGLLDRLRGATENMLTSDSFPRLLEVLDSSLNYMGFSGFWLSMFEDPSQPALSSRLYLASPPGGQHLIADKGIVFPSRQLIPDGLGQLDGSVDFLVVEALYSRQYRMGFIVFATNREGSQITGTLRGQISGALQAVLLLEERKHAEQQLIQSEKLAALGSLVAGVAHEVNTPLGVALTASTFLTNQAARFAEKFKTGPITKSELEGLLHDIEVAGASVQNNLSRAADLIASFKQVSSDQTSEQRRVFPLKEYLQETLVSLHFQWRKRPIEVNLEGPDNLTMDSYPGTIAQIITNLIGNSLLHAFARDSPGHISIRIEDKGNAVLLTFADDGAGIPVEHHSKVFEPFFTTKRGQGGTGLGLHIIFNLVTKVLGGTIGFTSRPGAGTRFDLLLPRASLDRPAAATPTPETSQKNRS